MATKRRRPPVRKRQSEQQTDVKIVKLQGMQAVVHRTSAAGPKRRAGAASAALASGSGATASPLLAALQDQELEQTHTIALTPSAARAGARRAATGVFDVDVTPHQSAVILLEQDGVWTWHFPEPAVAPRTKRRSLRGAAAEPRSAPSSVRISVRVALARPSARRGITAGALLGKAAGFVLKFVVRAATEVTMKLLERNVRPGLVVMEGNDVSAWRSIDNIDQLRLPLSATPRILLCVHGTFSSTVGSFGPLTTTADGRAFLDKARSQYQAIIGFDHHTLSETPFENAVDLLERMGRFNRPIQLDVVSFSRGGLVFRALVEQLLPTQSRRPQVGPAVFVSVPNSGTLFAEPENWRTLVDVYTNLATGALNRLGALPRVTGVSLVFKGLLTGLGALVKVLSDVVVTEKSVPGLAAQRPSGSFVRDLNQSDPSQPLPANTRYLAITSNFDANAAIERGTNTGLPTAFLKKLADGLIDDLMREPNDLVVNTSSMKRIDPAAGTFVDAALDFEDSPVVYHTVYFAQPEVAQRLQAWLLDEYARRGLNDRRGLLTVRPSPRAPFTRVAYHIRDGRKRALQLEAAQDIAAKRKPAVKSSTLEPRNLSRLRAVARRHVVELMGQPNPPPGGTATTSELRALSAPRARSYAPTLNDGEIQVSRLPDQPDVHVVGFQQTHAAIPIFGTRAVIELDSDERLVAARAKFARVDGVSATPKLSAQQAYAALAKAVPGAKSTPSSSAPASLTFFHDREHGRWHLAYLFASVPGVPLAWQRQPKRSVRKPLKQCCAASSPRGRFPRLDYLVDANDGAIVYAYSVSPSAARQPKALPVSCTGIDTEGELRRFDGSTRSGAVQLHDPQRGIRTFDLAGGDIDAATLPKQPISNKTHQFGQLTPAGVSAHFYTSRVFDFYNQVLIRKGVDDQGMALVNVVNVTSAADEPPPTWRNAVWWNKRMWYGQTRSGSGLESLGKHLDIIGHELTHGVTETTSGLVYRDEPGALNESFSDIFGILIKNWVRLGPDSDTADWDWNIGAGLGGTAKQPLRNLKNPKLTGDPDHMSDYLHAAPENDYGGVHTNSNIHNKAAYNLLTARAPAKPPRKRGALVFSPVEVARVYYFTLQRLDRMARFEDVLSTLLDVVKTVFPDDSEQQLKLAAVRKAYADIGIPRPASARR